MSTTTPPRTRLAPTITYDLAQITRTVALIISHGGIIQGQKTKQGGRVYVTIGPHQSATAARSYAMHVYRDSPGKPHTLDEDRCRRSATPSLVAEEYIALVGRATAREHVREWAADRPNVRLVQR